MRSYIIDLKEHIASYIYPLLLSIPIAPVLAWMEKYMFNDWEFINWLAVLIVLDTVLSWVYHWGKKSFTSKGFSQIFPKLISYGVLLIVGHVLGDFTVNGEAPDIMKWFKTLVYSAMIIREAWSVVEKLDKAFPGLIPKPIKDKLKEADEEGIKKN